MGIQLWLAYMSQACCSPIVPVFNHLNMISSLLCWSIIHEEQFCPITVQWLLSIPLLSSLSLSVFLSLLSSPPPPRLTPSIRPPIWLRYEVVGRGEWSGARDGATAGAQSDKERQITPLTRAIHHHFISPFFHPSLPPHLYLKMQRTWMATLEKKKIKSTQLYTWCCSHLVATHVALAAKSISMRFY